MKESKSANGFFIVIALVFIGIGTGSICVPIGVLILAAIMVSEIKEKD